MTDKIPTSRLPKPKIKLIDPLKSDVELKKIEGYYINSVKEIENNIILNTNQIESTLNNNNTFNISTNKFRSLVNGELEEINKLRSNNIIHYIINKLNDEKLGITRGVDDIKIFDPEKNRKELYDILINIEKHNNNSNSNKYKKTLALQPSLINNLVLESGNDITTNLARVDSVSKIDRKLNMIDALYDNYVLQKPTITSPTQSKRPLTRQKTTRLKYDIYEQPNHDYRLSLIDPSTLKTDDLEPYDPNEIKNIDIELKQLEKLKQHILDKKSKTNKKGMNDGSEEDDDDFDKMILNQIHETEVAKTIEESNKLGLSPASKTPKKTSKLSQAIAAVTSSRKNAANSQKNAIGASRENKSSKSLAPDSNTNKKDQHSRPGTSSSDLPSVKRNVSARNDTANVKSFNDQIINSGLFPITPMPTMKSPSIKSIDSVLPTKVDESDFEYNGNKILKVSLEKSKSGSTLESRLKIASQAEEVKVVEKVSKYQMGNPNLLKKSFKYDQADTWLLKAKQKESYHVIARPWKIFPKDDKTNEKDYVSKIENNVKIEIENYDSAPIKLPVEEKPATSIASKDLVGEKTVKKMDEALSSLIKTCTKLSSTNEESSTVAQKRATNKANVFSFIPDSALIPESKKRIRPDSRISKNVVSTTRTNLGFGLIIYNEHFYDTPVTMDFLTVCGYHPILFATSHYELQLTINNNNSEVQRKISTNENRIDEIVRKYEFFDESSYFDADEREFALLNRKRDLEELKKLKTFRPNKVKGIIVCGKSSTNFSKWADIVTLAAFNSLSLFLLTNAADSLDPSTEIIKRGADCYLPSELFCNDYQSILKEEIQKTIISTDAFYEQYYNADLSTDDLNNQISGLRSVSLHFNLPIKKPTSNKYSKSESMPYQNLKVSHKDLTAIKVDDKDISNDTSNYKPPSARLEALWNLSNLNPLQRIEFLLHFASDERQLQFDDALRLWEIILILVWQKDFVLIKFENKKNRRVSIREPKAAKHVAPAGLNLSLVFEVIMERNLDNFIEVNNVIFQQLEILKSTYGLDFLYNGKVYNSTYMYPPDD